MSQRYSALLSVPILAVFLFATSILAAQADSMSEKSKDLAKQAVSENSVESTNAINELRMMGSKGLDTLFEVYAADIKRQLTTGDVDAAKWAKIAAALDGVAKQRNSYAAQIYWYTDLEKAKAVAQKENKPILSLRLLGNLNEELSCANSRFFRTVLYPNAEISRLLRERYVLHWQSVRPVPKVTIDFGDGRKMETTLTGNSIHYVLDKEGKPLDALPGLYSPTAFLAWLKESERVFQENEKLQGLAGNSFLLSYHQLSREKIERQWRQDLAKVDEKTAKTLANSKVEDPKNEDIVAASAISAGRIALTKSVIEIRSVGEITLPSTEKVLSLEEETDIAEWQKIAAFYAAQSHLDANSLALMRRQTKADAAKLKTLVANFENYLALDTVRNEYLYHAKIHEWLSTPVAEDLDKFNDKVYAELFLTPKSDPWLGLYSPTIYAALEN